ncbi:MAG: ribosome small subunit-dependent GTPase A [Geothrix sp.]|uniref:ribosome small subunit-dependent GTPase A n=1 Tax=Geothrix sp. TaxID=1962974 RepID=UPI00182BA47C|nr:ribosome small subunit-dependent GTPase A [Geothrix sp.]NWJ41456.1 ribosome small subunit-dependent GTPase A [Geothrix sp.]WIL20559.1 MAG: ribosome small subunit-dependent GTPase A [Geothrix sp.]
MTRKFRLGQSREAQDMDHREAYSRERGGESKRRQQHAERLETGIEAHDAEALLRLPDPAPWMHLPEAILIQRHSQWVDLELEDRTVMRATLGGKLKGVRLVCGDRVRYSAVPVEPEDPKLPAHVPTRGDGGSPEAQVVAVMPRKTLLRRGGIDDREPWQLICANADELWICAAVVDPPLRPGLLERAQLLALDAGLTFRVIVTKRDRASKKDTLPELDPLREQGVAIHETSALNGEGVGTLHGLLPGKVVVLLGHSGVGKSTLVNALHPVAALKTGGLTKFGTGKQTTTASRWLALAAGGTLVDTPGIRTLSVRGLDRSLLARVFPEFPTEVLEGPMAFDAEDEGTLDRLELDYPERLQSLQRLWQEMEDRNPNQNVWR